MPPRVSPTTHLDEAATPAKPPSARRSYAPSLARSPLRRIALAAWLGALAGAIGAVSDCARAALRVGLSSSVRLELALGCTIVAALMGALLGFGLAAVWEATQAFGKILARGWPFITIRLARNLPVTALLVVSFASDGVFSGPGVSKMTLGIVGRWAFPAIGALLVVVLLERALTVHARLRSASRSRRSVGVVAGLALGALLLRMARLPQIDPYDQLQRYCELGAFLALLFGVSLFSGVAKPPASFAWRVRVRRIGMWALPVALCLSLPFLFSSSNARLALRAGAFAASPAVEQLRGLVDFDGDGYSPLLGGGDCDDFDRGVHPLSRDVPDDGVDQDCDGFDEWAEEAPYTAPPYGSTKAPAAEDLRARARGKNVLVVLVDALRFDRLQEPAASHFPRLAGLSRDGLSFSRALAPAAATRQVLPSILNGTRHPAAGAKLFHDVHAAGGETALVALDVVIDQLDLTKTLRGDADVVAISTEGKRSLWGGGVHVFTGEAITGAALDWLDARPRESTAPWLLWAHYFSGHQWDSIDAVHSIQGRAERYDAALADDDRAVGELLDGLAARGLAESTVVVLLADHGESVGDHGWLTHGSYLYPELVHVPMSIVVPGVAPRTISTPVPTAALTPTLLDLVGLAQPNAGSLDSLVPLAANARADDESTPRPIVMQDKLQDAIALGNRILRYTPDDNATELFSLDDLDSPNPESLAAREPETVRRMSRILANDLAE
jgi:hypothetical protein